MNAHDIKIGLGRILSATGYNRHGRIVWGWFLPGGVFTEDREAAKAAAAIIDRIMQESVK